MTTMNSNGKREARSKEQLLKMFEVIEGAKAKFSRGKNGKEVLSKSTSDTLKRKVDEAFDLSREEQNSKIVKEVIELPDEIWIALLDADGDQNLWLCLLEMAKGNEKGLKFLYSEKIISKVDFIVNDVGLMIWMDKLGDSLKHVKRLTIRNKIKTYQQLKEIYDTFNSVIFKRLRVIQPEYLTLKKTLYICWFLDEHDGHFTDKLKCLKLVGTFNYNKRYYTHHPRIEGPEQDEEEEGEDEIDDKGYRRDFYSDIELRLPSLLGKDTKLELIVQDVDVPILIPDEVEIEKATYINSYPNQCQYMKVNKLVIKNCNRNKVDGSYIQHFYANHCLISKCEIGTGDRNIQTFCIPECKFAYLDACHLIDGTLYYPVQGIYYNRCYLKDWVKSDLSKLEFVSFDKSDDYGYAKCIKYYTKNNIQVRFHTDEQFQDLLKKEFSPRV
jgi:hypothetical protein